MNGLWYAIPPSPVTHVSVSADPADGYPCAAQPHGAAPARELAERGGQPGGTERLPRGGADQVTLGADLVGLVVQHAETARPRTGHRQAHAGQNRHLLQGDLGTLALRGGRDVLAHPR